MPNSPNSNDDNALLDIAILRDGNTVYRATSPRDCAPIETAPVALIQAIYDNKPEQARRITRQRIYTTLELSESILGIVKVAAKRITGSLSIYDDHLKTESDETIVDLNASSIARPVALPLPSSNPSPLHQPLQRPLHQNDEQWMKLARTLAQQVNRQGPRYASDRPIAAILVSSENKILASAINTNAKNRTLHAEMNLLPLLPGLRIPPHSRLYTTLKPCKMCAGMIHDSALELSSLSVIFDEDDPGAHARNTALDRCSYPVQSRLSPEAIR